MISFDDKITHLGSKKNLLGSDVNNQELVNHYSLDKQVNEKTSKTLILVGDDDQQTALNILSVIYMSLEGYNSPLLVFRKYSYRLLQDLNRVSRVETKLLNIIADFTDYKKVEVEKLKLQNLQENKS